MRFYFLFVLSFCFLGCEAFRRAPPAKVASSVNAGQLTPLPAPLDEQASDASPSSKPANQLPVTEWGVVRCHESQYDLFNTEIQKFLSTTVDPRRMVTPVNCIKSRQDLQGGMWIRGEVHFENGSVFDPLSTSQQLDVSENSYLEIHIVGIDNKRIAGISLKAISYGGSVRGNFVTLAFADKKGKVLLNGSVENGIFSGTFEYENFITWQGGSQGHSGQIGRFSILACSLLNCGRKD